MPEYEMKTTFWTDFSIADKFGGKAVEDTYDRAFKEWKNNYVYLTELVMVLNWKLWEHYENGNNHLASLYNDFWIEAKTYADNHLKGEELSYYFQVTN